MEIDRNSVLLDDNTEKQVASHSETAPSPTPTQASSTSSYYLDAMDETEVNRLVRSSRPELIVLLGLNDLEKVLLLVHFISFCVLEGALVTISLLILRLLSDGNEGFF